MKMAVTKIMMLTKSLKFGGIFNNSIRQFSASANFASSKPKNDTPAVSPNGKVGFIGLGKMGVHMCRSLMKKGHKIVVFDIFPESMKVMQDEGAELAIHPADVAEKSTKIVTMLPSTASVIEVYDGSHGILRAVKKGTLLVDSSTIDPSQSQEIAELAEELEANYVDAPVSGGVIAAKSGSLTFMVGGDQKDFNSAKELLDCMGTNIIHCGEVGTGQAVKICNNMLLGISMIGVAETMNLGMRLGLDPKLLNKIINSSSGRCWSSEIYNPVPGVVEGTPSSSNYEGGFSTSLMTKDMSLAQGAAIATISPTPLGSAAHQLFRLMMQRGFSKKDFSSVFQFLQEGTEETFKPTKAKYEQKPEAKLKSRPPKEKEPGN
uniref:3-hydroxyisobutyrate dehydrogenase, mitochondrial n=1 Tax=Strigamia maritima TaxID=126957 RepID=T1ISS3_STRMM